MDKLGEKFYNIIEQIKEEFEELNLPEDPVEQTEEQYIKCAELMRRLNDVSLEVRRNRDKLDRSYRKDVKYFAFHLLTRVSSRDWSSITADGFRDCHSTYVYTDEEAREDQLLEEGNTI